MNGVLLISSLWILAAAGPPTVPVRTGSVPPEKSVQGNLCSLGIVQGLRPLRHLLVRTGPGLRFDRTGKLSGGDRVYVCNSRGEWLGIAYGGPRAPCGGSDQVGLDVRRTTTCQFGWVHRNWIEVITG